MANTTSSNMIFIDSTGTVTDSPVKIAYILFTPNTANDELLLRMTSSGSNCFYAREATAKKTITYDFSRKPLVFVNGLHVETLTSGAKVVIVTTKAGE